MDYTQFDLKSDRTSRSESAVFERNDEASRDSDRSNSPARSDCEEATGSDPPSSARRKENVGISSRAPKSKEGGGKGTKRKKPAAMPKRPLSAYNLFYRDAMKKIADSNTDSISMVSSRDLPRKVAEIWRSLDGDERKQYECSAKEGKRLYLLAVAHWKIMQLKEGEAEQRQDHKGRVDERGNNLEPVDESVLQASSLQVSGYSRGITPSPLLQKKGLKASQSEHKQQINRHEIGDEIRKDSLMMPVEYVVTPHQLGLQQSYRCGLQKQTVPNAKIRECKAAEVHDHQSRNLQEHHDQMSVPSILAERGSSRSNENRQLFLCEHRQQMSQDSTLQLNSRAEDFPQMVPPPCGTWLGPPQPQLEQPVQCQHQGALRNIFVSGEENCAARVGASPMKPTREITEQGDVRTKESNGIIRARPKFPATELLSVLGVNKTGELGRHGPGLQHHARLDNQSRFEHRALPTQQYAAKKLLKSDQRQNIEDSASTLLQNNRGMYWSDQERGTAFPFDVAQLDGYHSPFEPVQQLPQKHGLHSDTKGATEQQLKQDRDDSLHLALGFFEKPDKINLPFVDPEGHS